MIVKQQHVTTKMNDQNNKSRVYWMRGFLYDVYQNSSQVNDDLTLEEKIERLQRRLGGRPINIDDQLKNIDTKKADEKVKKMQEDLAESRKSMEGPPPVNKPDPELLARYNAEQNKIKQAKEAA